MLLTDTESLARQAAGGDRRALDGLLGQIRPEVLRRCRRLVRDPNDAEDVCQDVLLTISNRISSFEGRARFSTWLYPVVAHAAIDSHRRRRRRGPLVELPDDHHTSVRTSAIGGLRTDLLHALGHVDPAFATPVILRDGWGFANAEIGRLLGLPEGTVKSRVHEGRRRLQHLLAER